MKRSLLSVTLATGVLLVCAAQAQRPMGPAPGARVMVLAAPSFGFAYYDPFFWGAYGSYNGAYYAPPIGAVKFDTERKDAKVFVNGAYVGTVGKVKTLYLRPDSYEIEIRGSDGTRYTEKVYVAVGKTLHLHPELHTETKP